VRPLELSLEGFRSYRGPTTFDFQDRTLFGIVGPTGAGKSSILDGLIYSLYGRTPQIGKDTKKLITSGETTARVRLVFEVDGVTWEVTRVLRDPGASQVVLRRSGDSAPDRSGERAVNERVAEVVGLDYDSFCSSVTLPQGEFDRFLKATPTERSKILKRIFRYERVDAMKELAKQRVAAIDLEAREVQAELSVLPADPGALLVDLQGRHDTAQARVLALREGAAGFNAAQAVVAAAEKRLADIGRRAGQIETTLREIPATAVLETLAAEEDAGLSRLASVVSLRDEALRAAADADELAARREIELGGAVLVQARDLSIRRARAASSAAARAKSLTSLTAAAEKATGELERQRAKAATAAEAAILAEQALRAAQQGHAAHLLRGELRAGEPCPVCTQVVALVPEVGTVPEALEAATGAAVAAAGAAKGEEARVATLLGAASSASAMLRAAEEELAGVTGEVAGLDAELAALLGAGTDVGAELSRREAAIAEAAREAVAARKRRDDAGEAVAGAERALEVAARKRRGIAGDLIRIATILGVEPPGIEEEAAGLAGAAKRSRDAAVGLLADAAGERDVVLQEEAESRASLAGLRERLGLGPADALADALQRASEVLGALGERIERARAAIEQRQILEARATEIQGRRNLYQRLSGDFTDAKFTAYLLDADRQRLASVGSEKLFQLTGRYRFDEEGQFHLLDLLNDKVRSPDTLSGGETFLASLALALALAEAVSEGGSRLDCFFLDEGFGSLDAESLDLAMNGVTSLALPGRLIGVISHVAGVQAFLDDLIVLDKAPDGSTIVVQTEGTIGYAAGAI
jgi:exonuclease SbcC